MKFPVPPPLRPKSRVPDVSIALGRIPAGRRRFIVLVSVFGCGSLSLGVGALILWIALFSLFQKTSLPLVLTVLFLGASFWVGFVIGWRSSRILLGQLAHMLEEEEDERTSKQI